MASVVTLPHALLVTLALDAARWQHLASPTARLLARQAQPDRGSMSAHQLAGSETGIAYLTAIS